MLEPRVRLRAVSESSARVSGPQPSDKNAHAVIESSVFASSLSPADTVNGTRILVVDDDQLVCELLSHVLARAGYAVETASGAELALDRLLRERYDLVMCDMHLGGMTGLEMTALAVSMYPETPFILMTAHRDPDLMRSALRQGASDFVPKPFAAETLPIIIERSLERRALDQKAAEEHRQSQIFSNVQVLAAAIDAKEPFTAEHSRRVARLSRATAELLQLPATVQQSIDWAALVHDVGKIATPDHILMKTGSLTEDEWAVIRQHPLKGAQIVGQVQDLGYVAGIVRSHHERVDGAGYPDGLYGDQIPLPARIIAVSDAFEVMTSNRVYRPRISDEEALARLEEGAGAQFDAAVVEAFTALPEDVRG